MTDGTKVKLTEHTFPHEVRHRDVTGHVVLYAEKGRRRATFRFYGPDGNRSEKRPVPKTLGDAGLYLEPMGGLEGQSAGRGAIRVPELMIRWALAYLEAKADERRGLQRELEAARARQNHVAIGYVFTRLRQSPWYMGLAEKNIRRVREIDLPMRWVESVLSSGFRLSGWGSQTLATLQEARCEHGVATTTFDGQPTFLQPCSHNTFAADMRLLQQAFEEALEVPFREGSEAWLLDVNPMLRIKRKLPKAKARRRREVIDDHRYQLLLRVADEVDPSGRFKYFLVLLRWTGRRVSTILRLTRGVMLYTKEEIRAALLQQLCVYVLPHQIDRTASLYAQAGGAMYVRWWMVKGGQGGEAGKAEQFDAVHPVHPAVMAATTEYLEGYWNKLALGHGDSARKLGSEDPLIPGEVVTRPLSNETVYSWFRKAARVLAERGTPLGMTSDNAYHGLRYNRRTELYGVSAKYGRWLTEHSVLSGTPGITVSEGVYQGLVPPELVRAVRVEAPEWGDAWEEG